MEPKEEFEEFCKVVTARAKKEEIPPIVLGIWKDGKRIQVLVPPFDSREEKVLGFFLVKEMLRTMKPDAVAIAVEGWGEDGEEFLAALFFCRGTTLARMWKIGKNRELEPFAGSETKVADYLDYSDFFESPSYIL